MLLLLSSLALAQPAPPETAPPTFPALDEEIGSLRVSLAAATSDRALLQALLGAASTLASPSALTGDKVAAVSALAELGDARALPFLELAARQDPQVRIAVMDNAVAFPGAVQMHVLVVLLSQPEQPERVQLAAVRALDAAAVPGAFDELWRIATAEESPDSVSAQAREQLQASHGPAVTARGGLPAMVVKLDPVAMSEMMITSAFVGGTVLASVGKLGQSDVGVAIGGAGGAIIGGGLGLVSARANDVSVDNAYQYTSATTIGATAGALLAAGLEEREGALYLFTLGSVAGAGGALLNFRNEPSVEDTTELNLAILIGQQTGAGAHRWAYYQANGEGSSATAFAGLAGGAIGGGLGALVRPQVELDGDDAALMAAGGATGLWLSLLVPPAMEWEVSEGAVQTAIPLGTLAGAATGQLLDVPAKQTGIAAWGFTSGNLAGVGLPLVIRPNEVTGQALAGATLIGGGLGAAGGAVLSPQMTFDSGDAVLVPVGTALTIAEASAISVILDAKLGGFDSGAGLILMSAGLGSAGWGLASQAIDVSPGAPLLVAAGAGWGILYGGLTPVVLDLDGDSVDLLLSITATSTVLMAAATVAQLPAIGLKPQATVLPQLGGVGGAVLGSLGAALFSEDGQAISAGALGGSIVGIGAGIALERRYGSSWIPRLELSRPGLSLPGRWQVMASPTVVGDNEELGVYLGIQAAGL
jgi:hypothetical protein